jgi:uncharacterized membrane protein YkvA (DUF1232 family)
MTHDQDSRYIEMFAQWLRSLGEDAAGLAAVLASTARDDEATRWLIGGIHYVFKSLDLIPDGVEDLGFLDDAFVLRVACRLAASARPDAGTGAAERLASDAPAIREFLGEDYDALERYVRALRGGAARGRTVDEIASDPATRESFLKEVHAWADDYRPPSFKRDPKTLVKLKAFLSAKLR